MVRSVDGTSFILCIGVSLQEVSQVARLLRDRAVVLAASDLGSARALLAPRGADGGSLGDGHGARGQPEPQDDQRLRAGGLVMDQAAREVRIDGQDVHLSAREFEVLALLASDLGRVWTFAEMTKRVWGSDFLGDKEQLVSTVKRLRKRLAMHRGCEIHSVHGIGYRLRVSTS